MLVRVWIKKCAIARLARQTDKNPAEKPAFDFFDGFVLAEELGDGARHQCAKLYTFLSL
jgi:hypothetical protein